VRRVLLAALALVAASAPPAVAGGNGHGSVGNEPGGPHVRVGLQVYAPGYGGTGSGPAYGPHDGSAPRPVRYEAIPSHSPPPGLDNLCNATQGPVTPDAVPWGWWFTVVAIDTATGRVISREAVCVPLTAADTNGPPAPPAIPTPPTIAEIWDAVGIPAPEIGVNPDAEGVVGLDTWLWSGGATTVAIAVNLGGYTVTGVARRTGLRFDSGDGAATTTVAAGTAARPATTHVYERKGAYTLAVSSVWEAAVTMTGPGIPTPLPIAIGTAVVSSTRDYPVVEVRSVLVP
jgi:hypothetical protein